MGLKDNLVRGVAQWGWLCQEITNAWTNDAKATEPSTDGLVDSTNNTTPDGMTGWEG